MKQRSAAVGVRELLERRLVALSSWAVARALRRGQLRLRTFINGRHFSSDLLDSSVLLLFSFFQNVLRNLLVTLTSVCVHVPSRNLHVLRQLRDVTAFRVGRRIKPF